MANLARFILMRSLLKGEALTFYQTKGEALQLFIKKGKKLESQTTHIMQSASVWYPDTFFSKEHSADAMPYLRKVCLHNPMTISEYVAHWHQQNDYFALFPPHGRMA